MVSRFNSKDKDCNSLEIAKLRTESVSYHGFKTIINILNIFAQAEFRHVFSAEEDFLGLHPFSALGHPRNFSE